LESRLDEVDSFFNTHFQLFWKKFLILKMSKSLEWMMDAITRVKMNDPNKEKPILQSPANQATTNPTQ